MEKINIAEILKDCPKGMELDCTMFESLEFDGIVDNSLLPIRCRILNPDGNGYNIYNFTKYGCWNTLESAKCVIFPKGKTTWEGFQRPFKDGDIIYVKSNNGCGAGLISIYKNESSHLFYDHCSVSLDVGTFYLDNVRGLIHKNAIGISRFATKEEEQKLFDAIKENGYKWNAETKTLEKLIEPKFSVGDKIKKKGDTRLISIKDVRDNYYIITIPDYFDNCYITDKLSFINQGDYELFPNKFDITTLKEFDKVLVRGNVGQKWIIDFFGFMDKDKGYPFCMCGHYIGQCIPYEQNKHLLNTTNDCDEYYKTWK